MFEYEAYNLETKEETILFGYSFKDACRRSNLDPREWDYYSSEYND